MALEIVACLCLCKCDALRSWRPEFWHTAGHCRLQSEKQLLTCSQELECIPNSKSVLPHEIFGIVLVAGHK